MAADTAAIFEPHRGRLLGLAYRMLGSRQDAEDIVQEAYLRFHDADSGALESPRSWLLTVVGRLAIDRLRRLKLEREHYDGPWLPEPWVGADPGPTPADAAEGASDLSFAFLLLLERLSPDERAALLLHDVFDAGYGEVAAALGKSEAACRQIVHRARERSKSPAPRFAVDEARRARLLGALVDAMKRQDRQALLALLAADAVFIGDGGGKVKASLRPIEGAERVASFMLGVTAAYSTRISGAMVRVNGAPGVAMMLDGAVVSVMTVEVGAGGVEGIYNVANPDKLRRISSPAPGTSPRPAPSAAPRTS